MKSDICPTCDTELDVPKELRGEEIRCPECRSVFAIPESVIKVIIKKAQTFKINKSQSHAVSSIIPKNMNVTVTNIHMSFWAMVCFMIKWTLATIPAIIILLLFWAIVWAMITTFAVGILG